MDKSWFRLACVLVVVAGTAGTSAAKRMPPPPSAACGEPGYASPPGATVELVARQVRGKRDLIEVGFHNTSAVPVCMWSHYDTYDYSAWLSISLLSTRKGATARAMTFFDGVDKSTRNVAIDIAPGTTAWRRWNLGAWATRGPGGGARLARGRYLLTIHYDTTAEANAWQGALTTTLRFKAR